MITQEDMTNGSVGLWWWGSIWPALNRIIMEEIHNDNFSGGGTRQENANTRKCIYILRLL